MARVSGATQQESATRGQRTAGNYERGAFASFAQVSGHVLGGAHI